MATQTVTYVLCSTRSGSTWLALMLGSNERACYVGELARMFRVDPEGCSLCTERGQWCPLLHDIARFPAANVHRELFERSAADVLVDNSKSLSWLRKTSGSDVHRTAIHLLRDPRAVVHSWQRRGRPKGLDRWIEENQEIRRTLDEHEIDHRVERYNMLAERTDETLRKLCGWLDLGYAPAQQSYWETEHHGAGRNGATAAFLEDYVASDAAYYATHRRRHFHDLRWQQELDGETRTAIEKSSRLKEFLSGLGFALTEGGLEHAVG